MAYLMEMRKMEPDQIIRQCHSAWPVPAERLLNMLDDTLNSWESAQSIYDRHQRGFKFVRYGALLGMKDLVREALLYEEIVLNVYPLEAITYLLLLRWIEVE